MNNHVNVAVPVIYGAAVVYAQVNPVAPHAGIMPFQATITPPGRSLAKDIDLVFSEKFREFLNASNEEPPVTDVGKIGDWLSACISKIYNTTFSSLKNQPSSIVEDIPSEPARPPKYNNIFSITEIQPIFQNISNYFLKFLIPDAEKRKGERGLVGLGYDYNIDLNLRFTKTTISLETAYFYARGPIVSVSCRNNGIADLVENLCITYFKTMGAKVYVNDRLIKRN